MAPSAWRSPARRIVAAGMLALAVHHTSIEGESFVAARSLAARPAPRVSPGARAAVAELVTADLASTYDVLAAYQLPRGLDGKQVALPSLWLEQDRAVVAFLRHFG